MVGKCSYCGETSLQWEAYDGQDLASHLVCTECGNVQNEGSYDSAGLTYEGYASHDPTRVNNKRNSALKKECVRKLKEICSALSIDQSTIDRALALFEKLYKEPAVIQCNRKSKINLTIACVYLVCRQTSYHVTFRDVCKISGCTIKEVHQWCVKLQKDFSISVHSPTIEESVSLICSKTDFSKVILKNATKLAKLCSDSWTTTGCVTLYAATACVFIAWQADDPCSRNQMTVSAFCTTYKLEYTDTARRHCTKIKQMLVKLAEKIPWLQDKSLKTRTISFHLMDILQYNKALLEGTDWSAENASKGKSVKRKLEEDAVHSNEVIDSNNSSHVLCNSQIIDLDSEDIQEDLMSDSEVKMYLRSPAEISFIQKLRNKDIDGSSQIGH